MALQPALWDGPYKGALAGVVEMFRGSVLEAAGRVGVGGELTHGVVVVGMLGMRARVLVYWRITCCHRGESVFVWGYPSLGEYSRCSE